MMLIHKSTKAKSEKISACADGGPHSPSTQA
jgi:hypothetical protein